MTASCGRPQSSGRSPSAARSPESWRTPAPGARQIVTAATSATREARNQADFLARLRDEAGLDVHVVSGREEARLIYLSVLGSVDLGERTSLCLDIGGGSTEVIVRRCPVSRCSSTAFPLAPCRLAGDPNLPDVSGPRLAGDYKRLQRTVRLASARTVSAVQSRKVDIAYGTSRERSATWRPSPPRRCTAANQSVTRCLPCLTCARRSRCCAALTLGERRRLPGLKPDRADIIITGAVVLETLMTDLDCRR